METARRCCDPFAGTLRIGAIPTISPYLLLYLTPALHSKYPDLTLVWLEDKTHMLIRGLQAGTIDAALLALEAEIGDVESEVIAKDRFVLVAPAGNPLADSNVPARAQELRGTTVLVLEEEHCFGKQALEFCLGARAQDHEFRGTSLTTIISMVLGGVGVTLLPEISIATEVRGNELHVRPFVDPSPARTIGLVWRKRSALAPALKKLAATMREAYPVHMVASTKQRNKRKDKTKNAASITIR